MSSPWTFKEGSSGGGPPDFVGRLRQRCPKASLNNNNSFPNPSKSKEKPAGLKRRDRSPAPRVHRRPDSRSADLQIFGRFLATVRDEVEGHLRAFCQAGVDTATGLKHIARIGFDCVDVHTEAVGISQREISLVAKICDKLNLPIISLPVCSLQTGCPDGRVPPSYQSPTTLASHKPRKPLFLSWSPGTFLSKNPSAKNPSSKTLLPSA